MSLPTMPECAAFQGSADRVEDARTVLKAALSSLPIGATVNMVNGFRVERVGINAFTAISRRDNVVSGKLIKIIDALTDAPFYDLVSQKESRLRMRLLRKAAREEMQL